MEFLKKWGPPALILALFACLIGLVLFLVINTSDTNYKIEKYKAESENKSFQLTEAAKPTAAPEATSTSAPATATLIPTGVPPTATPLPTAVVVKLPKKEIGPCPDKSLGIWTEYFPDGKQVDHELFQKNNPYPGTTVLCEYESYFAKEDVTIVIPEGKAAIIADWRVNVCGSGVKCEGTWVAIKSFAVEKGTLVRVYLYDNKSDALAEFYGFACRYVNDTARDHTNGNIRVPTWWSLNDLNKNFGTIDNHPGCKKVAPTATKLAPVSPSVTKTITTTTVITPTIGITVNLVPVQGEVKAGIQYGPAIIIVWDQTPGATPDRFCVVTGGKKYTSPTTGGWFYVFTSDAAVAIEEARYWDDAQKAKPGITKGCPTGTLK